jgi:hypothetical protein
MAALRAMVQHLFERPGERPNETAALLADAAACHRRLLCCVATRARATSKDEECDALDSALLAMAEDSSPVQNAPLLNHPLLIDALHSMAAECPAVRAWDEVTVPPDPDRSTAHPAGHGREKLNNIACPCLLRTRPGWCGRLDLCTDALGYLRFPFSDWSLWLRSSIDGQEEALGDSIVTLVMEPSLVRWSLASDPLVPFLEMTRRDCDRLVATSDPRIALDRLSFPNPSVRPRLQYATLLGDQGPCYEPVGFGNDCFAAHAGLTGALVQALLEAIARNAPAIRDELTQFIAAIRGYELPAGGEHLLGCFSTPTLPGIMNINILYAEDDQPLLDPFCFTWLGHELGHTKHYLIDDAAYEAGWSFLNNPGDRTATIPRYQRSLAVRTLFQIPYVHLYELALLMAFLNERFAGLPWDVLDDPMAFGDDLVAEIREAFDLIEEWADLTDLGAAAVDHFRLLYKAAIARWDRLRVRA